MFSAWGGEQEKSFDPGQGIFFFLKVKNLLEPENLSMQMTRAIRHLWNLSV